MGIADHTMSSDEDLPEIIGPLTIQYLPSECMPDGVCGFPPEYAEFTGKKWKKVCGPWLQGNMDREFLEKYDLLPEEGDDVAEGVAEMSLEGEGAEGNATKAQTTKKGEKLQKGDKLMPGGKVKKQEAPCVTVEKLTRNKRKFTTVVTGLEHFGVKLKDAAKVFKKKFSCGCAVVKGDAGKPDTVEIQGDFQEEALDMISEHKEFSDVPEEVLFYKEGAKKRAFA